MAVHLKAGMIFKENPREYVMLPSSFFDWWFSPWAYAADPELRLPLALDRFAQRDGYRLWCSLADVDPDLPPHFHAGWSIAVTSGGTEFIAAARLFAGLMAAREHDQTMLGQLTFEDHKWCVSVAATQPIIRCPQVEYAPDESIEVCGLVELARRLESGFPGLWSRLRLTLPRGLVDKVTVRLRDAAIATVESDAALIRAQRCWRMCTTRIESKDSINRFGLIPQAASKPSFPNQMRMDVATA